VLSTPPDSASPPRDAAERMRRRAADWAAGALEGQELNRQQWRAMTPSERLAEAVMLGRIAAEVQRTVRPQPPK
jgi:hypothetical protein